MNQESGMEGEGVQMFHVTALSNLARGYDKYSRTYDKARIPESTFPDRFFLLGPDEITIGIEKAAHLPSKTELEGDGLIALETRARADELRPNLRTGLGRYVERSFIELVSVHQVEKSGYLIPLRLEEACARSMQVLTPKLHPYDALAPRSVSILPLALACQARCPFCFSKASVSADQESSKMDWNRVGVVLREARARGAERAVITGGGEPSLLPDADLERLVGEAAAIFPKVVLISNGVKWARMKEEDRASAIRRLDGAGLSVLAISRHHPDPAQNAKLMNLETGSERVAQTWAAERNRLRRLKVRWICVLQRGGVEDKDSLRTYLAWAAAMGVDEVCFKELYVSTSIESEYHDRAANEWSFEHQVPLRLVLDMALEEGWKKIDALPWGAPVFETKRKLRVAAYTEPSLLWERANGVCRSWNLMADGRCLASLEDRRSEVLPDGLRELQTVS